MVSLDWLVVAVDFVVQVNIHGTVNARQDKKNSRVLSLMILSVYLMVSIILQNNFLISNW